MRDYACNIFRFDFWNDEVCFFVWIYEMKQFKLQTELSKRSLSFNNVIITLTNAGSSAHIVELDSGWHVQNIYKR